MTIPWHTKETTDVIAAFKTSENGLDAAEAARRLKVEGANALPEPRVEGLVSIFLRQFKSPLIYILFVASALIFVIGELADSLIILAVLLFNALMGTIQEGRAQHTLRALKRYVETSATVVREGHDLVLPDYEVVRGDIIHLREGEKVAADARVLSVKNLRLDEASITGESEPTDKSPERLPGENMPAGDQHNMVFKGTHVVAGRGRAVVVATGLTTLIGRIAAEIPRVDPEPPLAGDIRRLSRAILAVVALVSAALMALGLYRGESFVDIFAAVVSLAVSIIPEGLPIVITLVLAGGVWRMSKRNALVKRLQAVEALGQATVIAVDKTGTITKNELVIREVWTEGKVFSVGGIGYAPEGELRLAGALVDAANHPELLLVGKLAALSADARVSYVESEKRWQVVGDPTEAALRVFAEKVGFIKDDALRESPLIGEVPFDSKHGFHATLNKVEKRNFLTVEGAPEAVLAHCTQIRRDGQSRPLRSADRAEIEAVLADMSARALRVTASAMRANAPALLTPAEVEGLTFVALTGMQDVLRSEVAQVAARARAAGVRVVMITGDHRLTAHAIAREAGIWREGDEILTGPELDLLPDEALATRVVGVTVFARMSPGHKLRIIKAYRQHGEIIAMTGDGVNDASSLVAADLGVAMGILGTEVAKEAADIILLDDDFGSIVSAIEEGRNIYKTIQKVMLYLFSTGVGEVLVIMGALALGYPLPILAAQIIWLNFVTDGFLDVALAMEPKEPGLLEGRFAKPKRYLVNALMSRRIALMALPMMVGTLLLFVQYVDADMEKAWTIALTTLAVFQWFNAWNCRSERTSLFRMSPFSNGYLVGATALVMTLHLLAVYHPLLQGILHTVPLTLAEWLVIVPIAASVIVVEELRKLAGQRGIFRYWGRAQVAQAA